MKKHQVIFPMRDLLPTRDGLKTFTVRQNPRLIHAKVGDALQLRFGAYNAATVVEATVARVEVVDFDALLDHQYAPHGDWLEARFDWFLENRPLELFRRLQPQSADHVALLNICEATASNPFEELADAVEEGGKRYLVALWWELPAEERSAPEESPV